MSTVGADNLADAPTITGAATCDPTPNAGYTIEAGEHYPDPYYDGQVGQTAWWKFVPAVDCDFSVILAKPTDTNNYLLLAVYDSAWNVMGSKETGSRNAGIGVTSAKAGSTYYIQAASYLGQPDLDYNLSFTVDAYWTEFPLTQVGVVHVTTGYLSGGGTALQTDDGDGSYAQFGVLPGDNRPAEVFTGYLPAAPDLPADAAFWTAEAVFSARYVSNPGAENIGSWLVSDLAYAPLDPAAGGPDAAWFLDAPSKGVQLYLDAAVASTSYTSAEIGIGDLAQLDLTIDALRTGGKQLWLYRQCFAGECSFNITSAYLRVHYTSAGPPPPPPVVTPVARGLMPPLRQFPRSDGLGLSGVKRIYPRPSSRQASNRRIGGYW